jgi:glutamine synthetase
MTATSRRCWPTSKKPGVYLDSDSRGNLKRIDARFRADHGLHPRVGCEPEMLWLKPGDDNVPYKGTTKPYAYHIDQFEQLSDVWLRVYDYAIAMGMPANGCHHNVSLWSGGEGEVARLVDDPLPGMDEVFTYSRGGTNAFRDENEVWLPGELHGIYDWYKRDEWNKFIWQVSDWDVKTYLDCLP